MADQDGRHSEMITELLRHVTSSRHVADAKSRCHYFYIREIKTRVYGKRQTSDSSLRFLKINDRYTKIVQNNSHVYG